MSLETIKQDISELLGVPVILLINRGRKKFVEMQGEVIAVYPSVFTVKVIGQKSGDTLSFSFSDVLCQEVQIRRFGGSPVGLLVAEG